MFDETFKETLVKKVEADSVSSKTVNIVTRSSKGRNGHYQKTTSRYGRRGRFFGSWASGYGAATLTTISHTQREGDRPQVTPTSRREEFSTIWDHSTQTEATKGPTRTTSSFPHAGRIRHFLHQWRSITQDPFILEIV